MSRTDDPHSPATDARGQPSGSLGPLALTTAAVACLALAFAIIAGAVWGGRAALGVAAGGAIAVVNLVVFARVVRGVLSGGGRNRIWILIGILKIFALFGGVWLLLKSGVFSPLSLVVGYGALPLGIALGTMLAARPSEQAPNTTEDPTDPSTQSDERGSRRDRK